MTTKMMMTFGDDDDDYSDEDNDDDNDHRSWKYHRPRSRKIELRYKWCIQKILTQNHLTKTAEFHRTYKQRWKDFCMTNRGKIYGTRSSGIHRTK
ncbi:hypothetical protein PoB_006316700 [Plakobranchus ocellatus]|uniref:Uncharacterized protein n=1 Tax=Plakobranchus ocellatus TaxID=259542 RepID=A0AAV4CXM4_9GAST|nr:hypothetical protein PoB_006316700 [Plakobranchus ocellatus]